MEPRLHYAQSLDYVNDHLMTEEGLNLGPKVYRWRIGSSRRKASFTDTLSKISIHILRQDSSHTFMNKKYTRTEPRISSYLMSYVFIIPLARSRSTIAHIAGKVVHFGQTLA